MKRTTGKIIGSTVAITLAGILSFQLVTNHEMISSASGETLSGIERIRNTILGSERAYQILEIVPERSSAELGYLINGSEPLYYFDGMDLDGNLLTDSEQLHLIPEEYTIGNSALTYEECSLWDETNHCWIGIEEKLNLFQTTAQKQSFMAFMIDRYYERMGYTQEEVNYLHYSARLAGTNRDLTGLFGAPSEDTFKRGYMVYVGSDGDYQMDLVPISSMLTPDVNDGNVYYYGAPRLAFTSLDVLDATRDGDTNLYYKRVQDYGPDGNLYFGYVLVGNYEQVIEDIRDNALSAKIFVNLGVSGHDGSHISDGDTYTITPTLVGYGYPDTLSIENLAYQIKFEYYYSGAYGETDFNDVTSAETMLDLLGISCERQSQNLVIHFTQKDYVITKISVKASDISLALDGVTTVDYQISDEADIVTEINGTVPDYSGEQYAIIYRVNYPEDYPEGYSSENMPARQPDAVLYDSNTTVYSVEETTNNINGYKFVGWTTLEDRDTLVSQVVFDGDYDLRGAVTLVPKWEEIVTVAIRFSHGLSEEEVTEISHEKGTDFTIPDYEEVIKREGYLLKGWSDGTNEYHCGDVITAVETDLTFNALWERAYTITFENGLSESDTDEVTGMPSAVMVAENSDFTFGEDMVVPARNEYTFAGWKLKNGDDTVYSKENGSVYSSVTSDLIFVAQWNAESAESQKTITFENGLSESDTDEVTEMPDPVTVNEGSVYSFAGIANLSRSGYIFEGWKVSGGDDTLYGQGKTESITVNADLVLVAQWSADTGNTTETGTETGGNGATGAEGTAGASETGTETGGNGATGTEGTAGASETGTETGGNGATGTEGTAGASETGTETGGNGSTGTEGTGSTGTEGTESEEGQAGGTQASAFGKTLLDMAFGAPLQVYAENLEAEETYTPLYPYYTVEFREIPLDENDPSRFSPEVQYSAELQKANEELQLRYENLAFVEREETEAVYLVAGLAEYRPNRDGNYTFTGQDPSISQDSPLYTVLTAESYGLFDNRDYFRRYVFDLDTEELNQFRICVHTYTPSELNNMTEEELNGMLGGMNLVYFGNGHSSGQNGRAYQVNQTDVNENVRNVLYSSLVKMSIPTIVDASIATEAISEVQEQINNGNIVAEQGNAYLSHIAKIVILLMQDNFRDYVNDTVVTMPMQYYEWNDLIWNIAYGKGTNFNYVNDFVLSYYDYFGMGGSIVNSHFADFGLVVNTSGNTGFEKVLYEIETENQYRDADLAYQNRKLDTQINLGRVIRYIINYTSQRVVLQKTAIRVLEIQPSNASTAAGSDELTKEDISSWVNGQISVDNITLDTMTVSEFVGHIDDLNSKYDLIYIGADISVFNKTGGGDTYTNENINSEAEVDAVCLFNFVTGKWDYVSVREPITNYQDYTTKNIRPIGIGKELVIHDPNANIYDTTWGSTAVYSANYGNDNYASGTDFIYGNYFYKSGMYGKPGPIRKQSSFVIQDGVVTFNLTEAFRSISRNCFYRHVEHSTVYNDPSMNGLIYTNIGDVASVGRDIAGMLDSELNNPYGERVSWNLKKTWVRYNGIDISAEKYNALMDFVDASYPVVVNSTLYVQENGERRVNASKVDNSSYMYDFLNTSMSHGNVFSVEDIKFGNSSAFMFYINRAKMKLNLHRIENEATSPDDNSGGVVHYLNKDPLDGKFYLKCVFDISNDGAVSENTLYSLRLYLDTNADGKFSEAYEELEGLTIYDSNNREVSYNALTTGVTYTVIKELPAYYEGVITWNLQVEQNTNRMIRCEEQGYTKLLTGKPPTEIRILQIMYNSGNPLNLQASIGTSTYNPSGDSVYKIYHSLVYGTNGANRNTGKGILNVKGAGISNDYDLKITSIYIQDYINNYNASPDHSYLDQFDMLILGFSDMYGDIGGEPLYGENGLLDFIESGRSVLFAHDTTGFRQYTNGWAYHLTRYIRNYAGMDTYGVTIPTSKQSTEWEKYQALISGNAITPSDPLWSLLSPNKVDGRYTYNAKRIAYQPGSARTQAVPEVHGYTTMTILRHYESPDASRVVNGNTYNFQYGFCQDWSKTNTTMDRTTQVNKINDGQITSYPYQLPDSFIAPQTHSQYYSLDFNADDDGDGETDLVVWYCLNSDRNKVKSYSYSYNDTVNNYYIYNKGNVTYTGVGDQFSNATIEEAKLFINTMVAAYNAGTRAVKLSISDENGNPIELINQYVDMENELVINEELQKIYFTYSDPNIVRTNKKAEVHFYMTKTGDADYTPVTSDPGGDLRPVRTMTANGVTYELRQDQLSVPDYGRTRSYLPVEDNSTIPNTEESKKDYCMLVMTKDDTLEYASVEDLTKEECMMRCNSMGEFPANTAQSSSNDYGYVKSYDVNTNTFAIVRIRFNGNTQYWRDVANNGRIYRETISNEGMTEVVELKNLTVHRKSDDSVVAYNQLQENVVYYVEVPINLLMTDDVISYDMMKNDFIVKLQPYYTSINKFTGVEKIVKKGITEYDHVSFASVTVFELE